MKRATRELRRPRLYVVATLVGVGAALVGLPWFVAVSIAVVALLAGVGVSIWSSSKGQTASRRADRPVAQPGEHPAAVFRREGEYWTIALRDTTFRLHDAKGLRYVHRLLATPGQEVHVLDLVVDGQVAPAVARAKPRKEELSVHTSTSPEMVLDRQAREAYRLRIEDLRDQIEEAEANGDHERASRAREELDLIADELQRQVRPDGSSRTVPDATERARVNVTRAIRASIAKVAEQDASLGHHLDHDIRTGTYCSYVPDPSDSPIWQL